VPHTISGADKRQWQRLAVPVPIFVRGVDEQGKGFLEFSTALNISQGGVLLVTRRFLSNASKISLEIPQPPVPKHMASKIRMRNLKARVIQVTNSDRYYLCGLKFTRPLTSA